MTKNVVNIQIASEQKAIPTEAQFELWVNAALVEHANDTTLTIRIIDAIESATLNEKFRKKTGPTNVLSFPTIPTVASEENYLGDIAICAPIVIAEAEEQNKMPAAHWAHLTIHGVLHLLGYDHVEDHQAVIMENLEIRLLNELGIENPYGRHDS